MIYNNYDGVSRNEVLRTTYLINLIIFLNKFFGYAIAFIVQRIGKILLLIPDKSFKSKGFCLLKIEKISYSLLKIFSLSFGVLFYLPALLAFVSEH